MGSLFSRWVEREEWKPPTVVDPRALLSGAINLDVHKYNAKQLVVDGRVALMMMNDGAKFELPDGTTEPFGASDIWQIVRKCWPNKVRRILYSALSSFKNAGDAQRSCFASHQFLWHDY